MKARIEKEEENMLSDKSLQIFLSYSRVNQQFALKLACELKSAGFAVWMDQFDIPTGKRWDDEIEKALRESQIFLFIMTPASIASENAKDEVGYAMDLGMRILPVLLEECEIPLRLRRLQYVDFTKKNFHEGINSAKELLSKLVDEAKESVPAIAESTREVPVIKEPRTVPTPKRSVSRHIQSALTARGRGGTRFVAGGIGIGILVVLIAAALFLRPVLFAPPEEPTASPIPQPTRTHTPIRTPILTAEPTTTAVQLPTEIPRSFTEDFDSNVNWDSEWALQLRNGNARKQNSFKYNIVDGDLIFDLSYEFVWGYFLYNPSVTYDNVEMEVVVADLRSTDTFGLICQFGSQGWYEFDIDEGGMYHVRYVDSMNSSHDEDAHLIDYGSIPGFKDSYITTRENTIRAGCNNNQLTLYVNNEVLMKNVRTKYELESGQIGIAVRSHHNYPIHVVVRSITVGEP
jgi:hypothetical protein